jgi:ribosomal protein L16 Arg81 hydroxylase
MNEEYLLDINIKNTFNDVFHKMILKPFYENFSNIYRVYKGDKNDLLDMIKNKDSSSLQSLNNIIDNKKENIYLVKKSDKKEYTIKELNSFQEGKSDFELMGGDTYFLGKDDSSIIYYTKVIEQMLNNNLNLNDDLNYSIINNCNKLINNIMSNDERKFIKDHWNKKSSLYKNQIAGKLSNEGLKSNIKSVKKFFLNTLINKITEIKPLSLKLFHDI